MDYKEILVNGIGSTTVINLNRPEKLNALNESVLKRMEDAVSVIEKDGKCKAVIITGSGEKAFSAGVDISYLRGMRNEKDASEFIGRVHALFGRIENMEKPVIGAINGFCIGGGLELALVCDIRIAASSATFGLPEGKLGIIPGGGATFRLPRTVGLAKAKEMIFTGESIGAEEAPRCGASISESTPMNFPIGLLAASTMNTSSMLYP